MMKWSWGVSAACAVTLAGCNGTSPSVSNSNPSVTVPSSVVVSPSAANYQLSIFAQAPGKSAKPPVCDVLSPNCLTKPDSVVQLGTGASSTIWIGYQDGVNADGTITAPSGTSSLPVNSYCPSGSTCGYTQVVQYDVNGNMLNTYNVPGHVDGIVVFNAHTIWVTSDEDANPVLTAIDSVAKTVTSYSWDGMMNNQTYPSTGNMPNNGGGLDDMQLINGQVFVSGSGPTVDNSGVYDAAAVYTMALNSDGKTFHLNPVLQDNLQIPVANVINASAVANVNAVPSTGNIMLGDPDVLTPGVIDNNVPKQNPGGLGDVDSSAVDSNGNLVLDSQNDAELVFVSNPGQSNQAVKELFLRFNGQPWPVDDTRWAPASSQFMLVPDKGTGLVYKITVPNGFPAGTAYSVGEGYVHQLNTSTGSLTPLISGLTKPEGLIFVQ